MAVSDPGRSPGFGDRLVRWKRLADRDDERRGIQRTSRGEHLPLMDLARARTPPGRGHHDDLCAASCEVREQGGGT